MNEERDKYLTEEVLNECWHEPDDGYEDYSCKHCGIYGRCPTSVIKKRIDFSMGEGFFKLWNYIKEKDYFDDFLIKSGWFRLDEKGNFIMVHTHWVNPDKVADAVYKFLNNPS